MEILSTNTECDIIVILELVFMVIFRQLSELLYHFVLSSAELKAISKRRLQWNLRTKISKEVINPFMTEAVIT